MDGMGGRGGKVDIGKVEMIDRRTDDELDTYHGWSNVLYT